MITDEERARLKRAMLTAAENRKCTTYSALSRKFQVNRQTIRNWQREDKDWGTDLEFALSGFRAKGESLEVPDFETFRREYFGHTTPAHQQEWFSAIEGHDISLILVPPEHGKTTALIERCVWEICKDRNVRIMYVCSNREEARKRLAVVQERLTDNDFYDSNGLRSVVRDFGPFTPRQGERSSLPWTVDFFSVTGRTSGEKDYTMQSLGIKGKIYGTRLDRIILDDIVEDIVGEAEQERHTSWILGKVQTRLSRTGWMATLGTRVHEGDLYGTFLSEESDWSSDWGKVIQPAVIDDEAHLVLWPEYWPYDELISKRRDKMRPRDWALIFQQQATGMPDNPFSVETIESAKNIELGVGKAPPGLNLVMGVDPAVEGNAAITVLAIDRETKQRYIVDCQARAKLSTTDRLKQFIIEMATAYRVDRCRIEKNFLRLTDDVTLRRELLAAGCQLEEEWTDAHNRYDPEWGILSVAAAFEAGLFSIPWAPGGTRERMQGLIDELLMWRPIPKSRTRVKSDRVDSLWLAELSARQFTSYRPGLPTKRKTPLWSRRMSVPDWAKKRRAV